VQHLANLPFIFSHVAVMPDAHAGRGSTVGTVIATDGAIIPAAVGVDIGCFVGDTEIFCFDNEKEKKETMSLKKAHERYGDTYFYTWAINSDSEPAIARAKCVQTRKNADLCVVTLGNEREVICTPDHEFMLANG
jgi:tRNA-splicing ligase RtcB